MQINTNPRWRALSLTIPVLLLVLLLTPRSCTAILPAAMSGDHLPTAIRTIFVIGAMAVLVLALLALWMYTLRRQLHQRTRALQQQESMLRTIIDSIPDLIFIKDTDSVYITFNRAFSDFCGLSEEELKGKTDFAFASHEEAEFYRQKDREMLASGHPRRNEEWIEYPDGRRVLLETLKSPYVGPDGEVLGVIGVSRDITAVRRSDELTRENSILQSVMNGAGDAHLVYLDRDFRFVRVNDNYARTCGFAPEEMIGKNHFDLYPHDENEEIFTYVRDTGKAVQFHDKPFVFPDQPERGVTYWDWTLSPVKDGAGIVQGLVFALRETTARKIAEETLLKSQEEASRLARVKADFLSHMSHEIRTPLSGVLGMAQVGLIKSTEQAARESFQTILESGKVLVGIIDDVLDFSKIEAGKLPIESVATSLRQLIEDVVTLVRENARARDNTLNIVQAEDLPDRIVTDPLRLKQILLNLISNAIKFTDHGRVTVHANRREEKLTLSIQDTGIGLTPDQIERLFHPFEQADASTTRLFGGTGLGLAITRQLVTLMGGEIAVASQPGKGSRFDVTLPLVPAGSAFVPESRSSVTGASHQRLPGLSILAVDDNRVNRLVISELLQLEGAHVVLASNGSAAVSEVRNRPGLFALALMDVQMPEMDGYETARRILELEPGLPIVGLTGFAMAEERDRCLAAGMVDHVSKPVVLESILPVILRHAKSRDRDEPRERDRTTSFTNEPDTREKASDDNRSRTSSQQNLQTSGGGIDWERLEARYANRNESLTRVLETVIESETGIPRLLRSAITARDTELLASVAHSLSGIAGLILAKDVLAWSIQTEMAAMAKKDEAFQHGMRLAEVIEGAFAEIREYLREHTARQT